MNQRYAVSIVPNTGSIWLWNLTAEERQIPRNAYTLAVFDSFELAREYVRAIGDSALAEAHYCSIGTDDK
jgi:hypothetical protein